MVLGSQLTKAPCSSLIETILSYFRLEEILTCAVELSLLTTSICWPICGEVAEEINLLILVTLSLTACSLMVSSSLSLRSVVCVVLIASRVNIDSLTLS